jgi:hypothetical protein
MKIVVLSTCLPLLVLAALLFLAQSRCPALGFALTPPKRALLRLKNRNAEPKPADFDARVSLAALVAPGDDRARWDEGRAALVEGYVVEVRPGGVEAANCFSLAERDTHIHVAPRADSPARETVVVEVTPRTRRAAAGRGLDWSQENLRRALTGRRCRFGGWLLYDREHDEEAENTAPGRAANWRATAWEIHPATRIEVLE